MRLWYSQSLQACASRGEWRTAVKLLSQVNRHLVDATIAEGRAEEVYSARCTECYAHTIAACSNAGQWAQLLQLYNEMESSGLPPRRASHNAAILALGKTGKTDQALALFHRIDMEASEGASQDGARAAVFEIGGNSQSSDSTGEASRGENHKVVHFW